MSEEQKQPESQSKTRENLATAGKIGMFMVLGGVLFFLYIMGILIWYVNNP